uniref:G-protein coupled receptors family 1 profile domain-containing protein n=1 Tax=Panagrolaimus sp. ES5 TaxID=591445 RepID=A0AC34FJ92_9BILA
MCSVYITVLAAIDCYFSVSSYKIRHRWCQAKFAIILVVCTIVTIIAYNFISFFELQYSECFDTLELRIRVSSYKIRHRWCQAKFATILVICTIVAIIAYNFISFFELQYSECFDTLERRIRYEICPTEFRTDFYVQVYKGYMYLVTMAVLPCILLVGLCIGIFRNMQRQTWSDIFQADATNRFLLQNTLIRTYSIQTLMEKSKSRDKKSGSSPLMLVVVIILFLLCNSVSLIVNCLEILTGDTFAELNVSEFCVL